MLIRCLHERAGGTEIEFGRRANPDYRLYHFLPNSVGFHVAEVGDEQDAATLLAIPSAYIEYGVTIDKKAAKAKAKAEADAKAAADAENDKVSFLDALDRPALEKFAAERNAKLDAGHDDDQVRNYLKGLILAKG